MFQIDYVNDAALQTPRVLFIDYSRTLDGARTKARADLPTMTVTYGATALRITDRSDDSVADTGPGRLQF